VTEKCTRTAMRVISKTDTDTETKSRKIYICCYYVYAEMIKTTAN